MITASRDNNLGINCEKFESQYKIKGTSNKIWNQPQIAVIGIFKLTAVKALIDILNIDDLTRITWTWKCI